MKITKAQPKFKSVKIYLTTILYQILFQVGLSYKSRSMIFTYGLASYLLLN